MPAGGNATIDIEPLGERHLRNEFSCGERDIDRWCRVGAEKDHLRYRARTYAATAPGSDRVVGIYNLSIKTLAPKTFLNVGFDDKQIPAIYLATLGVCRSRAKEGIATALMTHAFKRVLNVSEEVGAYCLWLEAINEQVAKFYEAKLFERFEPKGLKMYILTDTIRDAFKDDA